MYSATFTLFGDTEIRPYATLLSQLCIFITGNNYSDTNEILVNAIYSSVIFVSDDPEQEQAEIARNDWILAEG